MSGSTDVPASWAFARLDEIVSFSPKTDTSTLVSSTGRVHFVPMRAVTEEFGGIDISSIRPLQEVQKGYTSFIENDVLFAKITPCMENGKVAIVPPLPNKLAFGSTEFHVLRSGDAVRPGWLAYFLSQQAFRKEARKNMTGSAGQLRVPTHWLSGVQVPIAPLGEQASVIQKLEELLTDLDAGVAELRAAQAKLAQYRQSLLKAAVEGALTADWRARHAPRETGAELLARILQERRARWEARQVAKFKEQGKAPPKGWNDKYLKPVAANTGNLPVLPIGWTWASLDMLAEIQGGIQKQPSRAPSLNRFPFLRVANVVRGGLRLDEIHEIELFPGELERLALQADDVLVVEGNGSLSEIGRCAVWDGSIVNAVHQNHLIRARPILLSGHFIAAWLNSLWGIEKMTELAATTSGLYTLSVGKIAKVPVPVPPLDEQQVLLAYLKEGESHLLRIDAAVEQGLRSSAAQRQNILKAAFSGQLVPQDPNDEPASELLARIRGERAVRDAGKPARQPRRVKEPA